MCFNFDYPWQGHTHRSERGGRRLSESIDFIASATGYRSYYIYDIIIVRLHWKDTLCSCPPHAIACAHIWSCALRPGLLLAHAVKRSKVNGSSRSLATRLYQLQDGRVCGLPISDPAVLGHSLCAQYISLCCSPSSVGPQVLWVAIWCACWA